MNLPEPTLNESNTAWPVLLWPAPYAQYLEYDWHSGLCEFNDAGTVALGHEGCGFGTWAHTFNVPAEV